DRLDGRICRTGAGHELPPEQWPQLIKGLFLDLDQRVADLKNRSVFTYRHRLSLHAETGRTISILAFPAPEVAVLKRAFLTSAHLPPEAAVSRLSRAPIVMSAVPARMTVTTAPEDVAA